MIYDKLFKNECDDVKLSYCGAFILFCFLLFSLIILLYVFIACCSVLISDILLINGIELPLKLSTGDLEAIVAV